MSWSTTITALFKIPYIKLKSLKSSNTTFQEVGWLFFLLSMTVSITIHWISNVSAYYKILSLFPILISYNINIWFFKRIRKHPFIHDKYWVYLVCCIKITIIFDILKRTYKTCINYWCIVKQKLVTHIKFL